MLTAPHIAGLRLDPLPSSSTAPASQAALLLRAGRPTALLVGAGVLIVLAHQLDAWAWLHLRNPEFASRDIGRLFRVMGFLPLWALVGLALALEERAARTAAATAHRYYLRAVLVVGSAATAGLLAEIVKIAVRRERPGPHDGAYVFRVWAERPFTSSGLAMPSSHVLVAFGALAMLARLYPRAAPVWYLLGAGCAYARVAAGAHFLSDVVVAGILGVVTAELLWRRFRHLVPART